MTLEIELNKIKESTDNQINDIIRQKLNEASIEEYPATGMHRFYIESFLYKDYGYNIAINMFFNIERFGDICCCKDSLFLGVTPCQDSMVLNNEAKNYFTKSNFLCFSLHIGKNNMHDVVLDTHTNARNQIDALLKKQRIVAKVMNKAGLK